MDEKKVIGSFEIPEDLAKELSELLIKQTIRQRMLGDLIGQPAKYDEAEQMLIPIVGRIEALKMKITKDYVPEEFRSNEFTWNYDGWDVSGCEVQILK